MKHAAAVILVCVVLSAVPVLGGEPPVEDDSLPRPLKKQKPQYYAALAQVHASFGLWAPAEVLLLRAVELETNRAMKQRLSFELVDEVYVRSKQWDKAAQELLRTIGLVDERNVELRRKYHLDRARMLVEAGRREEHVKELEAIVGLSDTEAEQERALRALHAALKRLQRLGPKIAEYEAAVEKNPKDGVTLRILAGIYAGSGLLPAPLPGKAIEKYEQLRKLHPNDVNTCDQLAKLYRSTGQREKAIGILERLLSLNPVRFQSHLVDATSLLLAKGDRDATVAWCEKIERQHPKKPAVYVRMGSIYAGWREYAKAADRYRKAIELVRRDREKAPIYVRLAEAQINARQYTEAEKSCREALRLDVGTAQREAIKSQLDRAILLREKSPNQ